MTPEQFTEQLRQALPTALRSVVLYGSAAAGDHLGEQSDYNLLVVLDRSGIPELKALAGPVKAWIKAGNHAPLLFTEKSLRESTDVFPIEFTDLRDAHRVLWGEDPLASLAILPTRLRWQIEQEFQGKLLQLRAEYLIAGTESKRLIELLAGTVSKFLILMRATLRLYQAEVPAKKLDAARALTRHISFDLEAVEAVQQWKRSRPPATAEAEALFERYLRALDTVAQAVNDLEKGEHP